MENPIEKDDLGVLLSLETPVYLLCLVAMVMIMKVFLETLFGLPTRSRDGWVDYIQKKQRETHRFPLGSTIRLELNG